MAVPETPESCSAPPRASDSILFAISCLSHPFAVLECPLVARCTGDIWYIGEGSSVGETS